ncbi:ThuA domain-containing protein [Glycomyces buryatensis]|uniref:ThuA domain-containing protein n=1 Tax=Glycomyces buryatensis TaxID=2570927 RepID=A0A4S8Q3U3_9ACTN|nr:ThuA domain-containing protein [Glycomyces buryatensis]THV38700.1 ThuA domain-containing protein [Glycomyces buryatensis]
MPNRSILIFTKTTGFRHDSIPAGVKAIKEIATELGYDAVHTEDADVYEPESLSRFDAVVWLSASGDVLDELGRAALADYVTGGGGWCGIHNAANAEVSWPYYRELVGARFIGHPPGTASGRIAVVDSDHPSTAHLPKQWTWTDEWYSFDAAPDNAEILLTVDEDSYDTADLAMGDDHPLAWHRRLEAGRCFYTALGHAAEYYDDPDFRAHLKGGLQSVLPTK